MGYRRFKKIEKKPTVSTATYNRLDGIFTKNNWQNDSFYSSELKDRYYKTLRTLNPDEQEFFLDLTEHFLRIPQPQYIDELIPPLTYLKGKNANKKIYFARCIKEKDLGKNKSCEQILYLFKGQTMKWFLKKNYKAVTDLSIIKADELNDGSAILVLLDDFIGTGDTAMEALAYVDACIPGINKPSSINFLCVASLKTGLDLIRGKGYKVYTNHVLKKGITDYYSGQELVEAKAKMERIESRMKRLKEEFRFGYGQSEGLVCMERCPNNTFPIYWLLKEKSPYER